MHSKEKLKTYKKRYPSIFEELDKINNEFEESGNYTSITNNMKVTALLNPGKDYFEPNLTGKTIEITALYLWSKHKYVLQIDNTLQTELYYTPIPKSTKYLKKLPCICPYVDLQEEEVYGIEGFWVWIDREPLKNDVLQFLFLLQDGEAVSLPLEILDTFQMSVNKALGKKFVNDKNSITFIKDYDYDNERINYILKNIKFYINIVAYLCSEYCDLGKPIKNMRTLKEAKQIKETTVGEEVGCSIGDSYLFKKFYEEDNYKDSSVKGYEKVESCWEETENGIRWVVPYFGVL